MSGGKARGGGESWHGRGAVPGTGTVPFLLQLLQQAGGCTGMLWDPALVSSKGPEPDCSGHSPGCSGDPTPVRSRALCSLPPSLPPSSSSPTAPAPLCHKLLQPLCTSRGLSRASTLSLAWEGCKSPRLPPVQGREGAGGCHDQEDAREGSGMLRRQVLPRGRCQQCLLGPAGTSLGQGGPGWEVNPTWWAGASFHWLH